MTKYKGVTHAVAAALGALVLAGLSPQGQSLIAKMPHGQAIYAGVAFVGVLLGVYHMPLATQRIVSVATGGSEVPANAPR